MYEYFKYEDFACKCCGRNVMDLNFIKKLDYLRYKSGVVMPVNSGFRCHDHNNEVGSNHSSQHRKGLAADISIVGNGCTENYRLLEWAILVQFRGIGIYKNFIHLDMRETEPVVWIS